MNRFLLIFLGLSVFLNIFLWSENHLQEVDRKPPWAPFTVNPNLTLESLVKSGYKFGSMPCRQVQFYKTIADTTIQYEVGIDCKSYNRNFDWLPKLNAKSLSNWEEINNEDDPYYPFDSEQVTNCHQEIVYRVYRIRMKNSNRAEIVNFVYSNNGIVVENTEKWNPDGSGSLMVYNRNNTLYFKCLITKESELLENETINYWEFKIISNIPILDIERIRSIEKRAEKRYQYNEEQMFFPNLEE